MFIYIRTEGYPLDYRDENGYYYSDDKSSSDLRRERNRSIQRRQTAPKKHTAAVEKRIKKKTKKEQRKLLLSKIFKTALLVAIVCIIIGAGVFVGMYAAVSTELKDMNIDNLALNYPSYIYYEDKNSNVKEYDTITSADNIIWVESDEISDNMKNAIVAIEDERFYSHNGVDLKRTTGAVIKYALSKIGIGEANYGGSTITQQVIKNITQEKSRTATRKIKEIMRAVSLEKQLDKDQILTLYLNVVFFANQCYGVESASNTYFNKSASELTIPEAALIAGITQTPSRFNPYTNPQNALEKRNIVLGKMYELKMISKEDYEKAVKTDLNVVKKSVSRADRINSYFVDQLIADVISDLRTQHGYSEDFAKQQLYNGGLKIYSTIDPNIQNIMEDVYKNASNFPGKVQSAMTIIDPYTGQIKGMVGGTGTKTSNHIWNRATQTKRQPGSSIKPLSAYAPAIEEGEITQASVLQDKEITIGSDDWSPSNSYKGFKGYMSIHEAIGRSCNTIAVQVVDLIGINTSYSYLQNKFHLNSVENNDKNYSSLALGGLTNGASVTEMAGAYSTFVNSGKYIKPHTYVKVVDSNGKVLLENKEKASQSISAETAYIMSDLLLQPVNYSYGTAQRAKLSGIKTYGKTGTTNDNYDKWFIGFTPYYVGAVWCGYDSPQAINSSSNPSTAVWKTIMARVHEGLSGNKEIKKPSNVIQVEICENSGKLAKSHCNSINAYFKSGTQPVQFCKGHKYSDIADEDDSPSPSPSASPDDDEDDRTEGDDAKNTLSPQKTSKPSASQSISNSDANNKDENKNDSPNQNTSSSQQTNSGGIPQKVE